MPYRVGQSQSSSERQHFRKFTLASRLPDNPVPRSPREPYCTTGEAYPEPLIYQCSWFAAFKPPALGIFRPFKLAIYLYHLGIHRPWKFDLLKHFHCLISPQPQQIGVCRSSQF